MRKLQTGIFSLLTFVAASSLAGEMIDKTLPINNASRVNIENLRGNVEIIGTTGEEVSVKGELDDQAEGFIFEQDGSLINIKVKMPRNTNDGWNKQGSILTIHIPKTVRVDFSGVSSDVQISNFSRSVEVKTVSGDIDATNLEDNIEVATISGDIKSEKLSGKVALSSISGEIDDSNSSGRLEIQVVSGSVKTKSTATEVSLNNVSGEISAQLAEVDELKISTVSGDFDGKLTLNDGGSIRMSSVSGDTELRLNKNVQASFKLQSNAGGRIVNKLTNDKVQRAKYGPGAKLNFETGNGDGSVRATTVSGRIEIDTF